MADASDLKSDGKKWPCGFKSRRGKWLGRARSYVLRFGWALLRQEAKTPWRQEEITERSGFHVKKCIEFPWRSWRLGFLAQFKLPERAGASSRRERSYGSRSRRAAKRLGSSNRQNRAQAIYHLWQHFQCPIDLLLGGETRQTESDRAVGDF